MEPTGSDAIIVAAGAVIVRQVIEMWAKSIPDHVTGWRGRLRQLLKILALYIPNKP